MQEWQSDNKHGESSIHSTAKDDVFYEESKSRKNNHTSEHTAEESMVYKAAIED